MVVSSVNMKDTKTRHESCIKAAVWIRRIKKVSKMSLISKTPYVDVTVFDRGLGSSFLQICRRPQTGLCLAGSRNTGLNQKQMRSQ